MARTSNPASVKVFDALAAPLRLRILRLVYSQGPLSYSEIMAQLNLNPNRDTGKFAYHLRTLHNAGILATEKETKKYCISSLGAIMLETAQNVETESLKERGRLLVRTSRLAMEDFDHNKIVQVLIQEAGVPVELARKVAEETEERLLRLDTLYLTAPLIREFVNAVLIEKGLHEYRHKLTRLGLPVYDISQLMKREISATNVHEIHNLISRNVFTEYALLNVLPRRIADAHLAGLLHVDHIDSWVLRPLSIQHDLRVFLRSGFQPGQIESTSMALDPPKNMSEALDVASSCLWDCGREVAGEQTVSHFNVFLAPFARDISKEELDALLKRFLITLGQASDRADRPVLSLSLDLAVPTHMQKIEAIGPRGKPSGTYENYFDEAKKILDSLVDNAFEDTAKRPIFNPRLILNLTTDNLSKDVEASLLKAHELAAERGTPIFTNLTPSWQKGSIYHSNGLRLTTWSGDWELDTMRTGTLGSVGINLPRVAYEARGGDARFFGLLDYCLEMAIDALKIKAVAIENLLSNGLPFLSRPVASEPYFRLTNSSFLISPIGLNEATKVQIGKQLHETQGAVEFALRVITKFSTESKKLALKIGHPIALAHEVSKEVPQRLAELDVEKYGWGTVFTQGTRDAPYYTDMTTAPLETSLTLRDRMLLEGTFHPILKGGHLLPVELAEPRQDSDALLATTKEILNFGKIGAFTYTRTYGYCSNCHRIHGGNYQKCPQCKAVKTYSTFSRLSSSYQPLNCWPSAKLGILDQRRRYRLMEDNSRA